MDLASDFVSQTQSLVAAFANHGSTVAEDRAALLDFLRATPQRHVGAAYFIDNLAYRLYIAEQCQRWTEENRLPSFFAASAVWAILMVAPKSFLN